MLNTIRSAIARGLKRRGATTTTTGNGDLNNEGRHYHHTLARIIGTGNHAEAWTMAHVALRAWRAGMPLNREAVEDVIIERQRQISQEGYGLTHDDQHMAGELAIAAGCYLESAAQQLATWPSPLPPYHFPPTTWPWRKESWKPKDARRDLVRAAALILAEIERLDRAETGR